tara:strand:- start:64933 stop:65286 length:354 start_codon:yes stop_codon:yes gene_type:complete
MSSKIIKSQFNDSCISGLHLSLESSALFANRNKLVCLEVGRDGINLQPGPGGTLFLNTWNVEGPLYRQSMPPMDFLPNIPYINMTPRKRFNLPAGGAVECGICVGAFAAVLGGIPNA